MSADTTASGMSSVASCVVEVVHSILVVGVYSMTTSPHEDTILYLVGPAKFLRVRMARKDKLKLSYSEVPWRVSTLCSIVMVSRVGLAVWA